MTDQNYKNEFYRRVYIFTLAIIRLLDNVKKDTTISVITHQLLRSSTSIIANIVEAKSASSRKDYINFFTHALKSTNESKVWLCLLRDARKVEIAKQLQECEEIAKILAKSILTLKNK